MPLRRLLPLLSCPLCAVDGGGPPRPLLRHPFTLHCGHTVCSSHLETLDPSQRCPLPICSATPNSNIPHPNIPSSSRVIYLPPVPTPGSARPSTSVSADQHEQRTDITISKLIEVVSRYSRPSPSPSNRGDSDLSDGDDHQLHPLGHSPPTTALPSSDEETEFRVTRDLGRSSGYRRRRRPDPERAPQPTIPNHSESTSTNSTTVASADSIESGLPPSSGHAGRSCFPPPTTAGGNSDGSDSTIQPPKKRPRHDTRPSVTDQKTQSHAIEPGAETGNSENIYPPGANGLHSSRLGAEPRGNPEDGDENPQTRIEKELLTELTCEICLAIYFQPVTALCQHTFCGRCLQRSLDHRSHCPICRADLPDYAYLHENPQNKVILSIELEVFPELYAERGRLIVEEERNARLDTPLFVCQLSFPGVPTTLHFFEPRYRLMLRRCLESPTPRFGMIMSPKTASTNVTMDFGTMLEIRSVRMLQDGRSLVQTWGVSRFRVLERGTLDGYMVGRIEYIEDLPEELEDTLDAALAERVTLEAENQTEAAPTTPAPATSTPPSPSTVAQIVPPNTSRPNSPQPERPLLDANNVLMNKCRVFVEELRDGAAPWIVQKLNDSYGNMPTDAPNFSFWVALVLPIDEYEKAKLLPIRSARLRLRLVAHWIDQLNRNW